MKASDLRIGNYLMAAEAEFVNHPAFKIQHGDIAEIVTGSKGHKYKPVALDSRWLISFGAEKINNSIFRMGALTFQPTTFAHGEELMGRLLNTRKAMRICFCGKFLVNIEFVHHLQNLYHALTGEELTIK